MISWNYEYEPFHIYRGSGSCWIPMFPQTKQLFKEQTVAERFSWLSSRRKYLPPLFFCGRRFCVRVLLYFFIKIYLRLSHCLLQTLDAVSNQYLAVAAEYPTSLTARCCRVEHHYWSGAAVNVCERENEIQYMKYIVCIIDELTVFILIQ